MVWFKKKKTEEKRIFLTDMRIEEVSSVPKGANEGSRVVFYKAKKAYKTEGGKQFPASDYAYVPDPEKPSTWKLRLTSSPGGKADPRIVGAALAALGPGFRGQKVQLPIADRTRVILRVRRAWLEANPGKEEKDLPAILKSFKERTMTEELQKQITEMEQKLQKAEFLASLCDVEKGHYAKLSEEDQTAFQKMSVEQRLAVIQKAVQIDFEKGLTDVERWHYAKLSEEDQIAFQKMSIEARRAEVHKNDEVLEFGNQIIRKSDIGDKAFAVMKHQQDQIIKSERLIKAEQERRIQKDLELQAEKELPYLKGTPQEKAAMLHAISKMSPELRGVQLENLKAANAAMKKQFREIGQSGDPGTTVPLEKLNTLAKEYEKEHKCSFAKAYSEVLKSAEGQELYTAQKKGK